MIDAIVLLGCRIAPSGRLSAPAARRAATAARAYLDGIAPVVIASGGRRWGSQCEARALRGELVAHGVPEGAVVEELCSLSTYENAIFTAALLRGRGARRAAIVTCPWHMERALENFRDAGVDAVGLPSPVVPFGLRRRAWLAGHEVVCRWLDAQARRRGAALREGARRHASAGAS